MGVCGLLKAIALQLLLLPDLIRGEWPEYSPPTNPSCPNCSFICKLNGFCSRVYLFLSHQYRHNVAGLARPNFRSWTSVQSWIFQQHRRTRALLRSRKSISWGRTQNVFLSRSFLYADATTFPKASWCNSTISHFQLPARISRCNQIKWLKNV